MALLEPGPAAADLEGLARWRCVDLAAQIKARWHVTYHPRTVGKLLHRLSLSHITARPQHYNQDAAAMVAFKKLRRQSRRYPGDARARHRNRACRVQLVSEFAPRTGRILMSLGMIKRDTL